MGMHRLAIWSYHQELPRDGLADVCSPVKESGTALKLRVRLCNSMQLFHCKAAQAEHALLAGASYKPPKNSQI